METLLLFSALFLAVVFGIAGIAKIFDIEGSQKAVEGFGVPHGLAKAIGLILPVVEIAIAFLLIPLVTRWIGAFLAFGLLLTFIGGMVFQMIKGNAPDCHCFGQIHSEPVGWSTLIRNSAFLAVAGFLVFFGRETGGTSAVAWLFDLNVTERLLLIFGILMVFLMANAVYFLRQILVGQTRLHRQIELMQIIAKTEANVEEERENALPPAEGLPIGAFAPNFELSDLAGKTGSLENVLKIEKKGVLLFFVSPNCQPCQNLLPEIGVWQKEFADKFKTVFVSSGTAKENQAKFGENTVFLQKKDEVMSAFRAKWTPTAVFINSSGKIGSKLATGDANIRALVENIAKIDAHQNGHSHLSNSDAKLKIGEFAPTFTLPNIEGKTVSLQEFRGKDTLLIYWSVGCGFCQQMFADLRKWETENAPANFQLVLISLSGAETMREQNFSSPVLIQGEEKIGDIYDFGGTPSGYLIDKEGKIASERAVGADDIFALVGHFRQPHKH